MFTSEAYTIKDNTTSDRQIINYDELFVKVQYLCSMKESTNWFWHQHPQQEVITVPTRTLLYPRIDVTEITDIYDKSKSVCNRTQEKKPYQDFLFF